MPIKCFAQSANKYAGALLLISLVLGSLACSRPASVARTTSTAPTPTATKQLGIFAAIEGTEYLRAPIYDDSNRSSSYGSYDSYGGNATRNYVFLSRTTETFQQLLPTNDYAIVITEALAPVNPNSETQVTQWWLYGIVKSDTDGDTYLTQADKMTLALSDVGGTGYAEIIADVDNVYGHTLRDEATLLVIYQSAAKKYLARIDIIGRVVAATTELPPLGSDVK